MSSADIPIAKPAYWDEAVAHLMRRDRILRKVIPKHPEVWLTSRGTPFVTLARAIVGQQISTKAADAVWQRYVEACGRRPGPAATLRAAASTSADAGAAVNIGRTRIGRTSRWNLRTSVSLHELIRMPVPTFVATLKSRAPHHDDRQCIRINAMRNFA